jgi:hypothetical protein
VLLEESSSCSNFMYDNRCPNPYGINKAHKRKRIDGQAASLRVLLCLALLVGAKCAHGVRILCASSQVDSSTDESNASENAVSRRRWRNLAHDEYALEKIQSFVFHGWNAKGRAKGQKARLKMLEMTC